MKLVFQLLIIFFPWRIRRFLLVRVLGFDVSSSARVGLSLLDSDIVKLGFGARIGHFSVFRGLEALILDDFSSIGNLNWITGFRKNISKLHFATEIGRVSALRLMTHSAITSRHIIDCTNSILIGRYSILGGFRSQILTHSIDISLARQTSAPVTIGDYVFVGTGVTVLKGTRACDFSVIAAGAVVAGVLDRQHALYGGVPARYVMALPKDSEYFSRVIGYVI